MNKNKETCKKNNGHFLTYSANFEQGVQGFLLLICKQKKQNNLTIKEHESYPIIC